MTQTQNPPPMHAFDIQQVGVTPNQPFSDLPDIADVDRSTGDEELDELVGRVFQVPPESQLIPYMNYVNERSVATAGRDQPLMALMSAVSVFGIAAARVWRLHNLSTTTMMVCVGPSGCGKEQVLKTAKHVLASAQLKDWVGSGAPASGAAILMDIANNHPIRNYMIDECSEWFEKVGSQANTDVTKILREEVGRDNAVLFPSIYANTQKALPTVEHPGIGILATTTPTKLAKQLSAEHILNGFVQRFLFVPALKPLSQYRYVAKNVLGQVPPEITSFVLGLANGGQDTIPHHRPDVDNPPNAMTIGDDLFNREREMIAKENANQPLMFGSKTAEGDADELENRHRETAKRLGMILALSCGRTEVSYPDFLWGMAVAEMSTRTFKLMLNEATKHGEAVVYDKQIVSTIKRLIDRNQTHQFDDDENSVYVRYSDVMRGLGDKAARAQLKDLVAEAGPFVRTQRFPARKPASYIDTRLVQSW